MSPSPLPSRLRVGEMFCGPGGIGLALNRAKSEHFAFEHVFATDYDADTCRTYQANVLKDYPEAKILCEDVRNLSIEYLPPVDGFLYGFPCNDFSLVGKTKGLNGQFGGLYAYGVEYINRNNPLFFFAENVSGLRSANEGKAFNRILCALNHAGKFGYTITAHLYKFEEYGVPQARHRFILVGLRGDLELQFNVPKPDRVFTTCREALENIPADAANQEPTQQSSVVVERLSRIPEGKNIWQATQAGLIPPHLQLNVRGAKLSSIYRRLDSTKPAYTITGSGGGVALMFTTGQKTERLPIESVRVCRPSRTISFFTAAKKAFANKSEWLFRSKEPKWCSMRFLRLLNINTTKASSLPWGFFLPKA